MTSQDVIATQVVPVAPQNAAAPAPEDEHAKARAVLESMLASSTVHEWLEGNIRIESKVMDTGNTALFLHNDAVTTSFLRDDELMLPCQISFAKLAGVRYSKHGVMPQAADLSVPEKVWTQWEYEPLDKLLEAVLAGEAPLNVWAVRVIKRIEERKMEAKWRHDVSTDHAMVKECLSTAREAIQDRVRSEGKKIEPEMLTEAYEPFRREVMRAYFGKFKRMVKQPEDGYVKVSFPHMAFELVREKVNKKDKDKAAAKAIDGQTRTAMLKQFDHWTEDTPTQTRISEVEAAGFRYNPVPVRRATDLRTILHVTDEQLKAAQEANPGKTLCKEDISLVKNGDYVILTLECKVFRAATQTGVADHLKNIILFGDGAKMASGFFTEEDRSSRMPAALPGAQEFDSTHMYVRDPSAKRAKTDDDGDKTEKDPDAKRAKTE